MKKKKKKLSFTHCGFIGHREHPFQTEGERNHPSAGLLRIFMTGECLSSYSLAGFLQGSPGWDKTLMTHQVSWLEATVTNAGMEKCIFRFTVKKCAGKG